MLRIFLSVVTLAIVSAGHSAMASDWDTLTVDVREVDDATPMKIQVESDCSQMAPMGLADSGLDLSEIDLSQIIAVGEKVWKVIEANKPVVNVKTDTVSALPKGIRCWNELEKWQAPKTKSYEVVYKNYFGWEVVHFRFRLQYTYGGGKEGVGKYLANVTVLPAELNVLWGYTFNAEVEVMPAVNLGSKADPMAGLEINVKWAVNTVVKDSRNSFHLFVQGDGVTQADN